MYSGEALYIAYTVVLYFFILVSNQFVFSVKIVQVVEPILPITHDIQCKITIPTLIPIYHTHRLFLLYSPFRRIFIGCRLSTVPGDS